MKFREFSKKSFFLPNFVENVKFCKFSNNDNFWTNYRINTLDTSLKSLGIIFFENKIFNANSLDLAIFEDLYHLGLTEWAKNRKFGLHIPKAIIPWKIMKNHFFFIFLENFGHKLSKNVPGVLIRLLYPNLHKNEIPWITWNFIKNPLFWKILVEIVKFWKFSNYDNFWTNYRINTLDTPLRSFGIIFFENKFFMQIRSIWPFLKPFTIWGWPNGPKIENYV